MDEKTKKMRKLLFTPLKTKKDLHAWIKLFLGLDLPDCTVDPDSNSNPMDAIWEAYWECLKEDSMREFSRYLVYANRDGYKTVSESVFECLALLHLRRDVCHQAALEQQSDKAQSYIRTYFGRPYLRDFVVSNSRREFEVIRYYKVSTGEYLTIKEWKKLHHEVKFNYEEQKNQVKVIVATLKSSNGEHAGVLALDELDLMDNPQVYEETKMVPTIVEGKRPITYMTSSRKFTGGLVQKEIDLSIKKGKDSGLAVRHWNIIDVAESCPAERHRPDLPKLPVFTSRATLRTLDEKGYSELGDKEKEFYVQDEAYNGCLNNCKIFAQCRGLLATKQTSSSSLLRPIDHLIDSFSSIDSEVAKAQLMCWKPSSEGMIYSRLDRNVHMKTPSQLAEMIIGRKPDEPFSRMDFIKLCKRNPNVRFYAGMDFGFTHMFAVVLAAVFGNKIFILDAFEESGLEVNEQIELCNEKLNGFNPAIYADVAYPGHLVSFRKAGYAMKKWQKKPESVVSGIEVTRKKIMAFDGKPELFFLKDHDGCDLIYSSLESYRWATDAQGGPTDKPNKHGDDLCDAFRYFVMNVFGKNSQIAMAPMDTPDGAPLPADNWMRKLIDEATGGEERLDEKDAVNTGKKGKLGWSF